MKKIKTLIVVMTILILNVLINPYLLYGQKNFGYVKGRLNIYLPTSISADIPEDFRNVPRHKDDGGGISGPIGNTLLGDTYYTFGSLTIAFGYLHFSKHGFVTGLGINLNYNLDNMQERNYTNAVGTSQRGYGAALTFCQTSIHGPLASLAGVKPALNLSFTPEIIIQAPLYRGKYPKLSLTASYQALMAINGWDRYDAFEINDKVVLAHMFPLDLGIVFGKEMINFELGTRMFLVSKTKKGEEFNVKIPPVSLYFCLSWNGGDE